MGPAHKLALIRGLTIRIELPGLDFGEIATDSQVTDPEEQARGLKHRMLAKMRKYAFGQRATKAFVSFEENRVGDSSPLNLDRPNPSAT